MKTYLCVEHGEFFTLEAVSFVQAQEDAALYGGSAVRELTPEEYASKDEKSGACQIKTRE